MATRHQLARYPDHVQAIGMISLETVDLELQLAALFSRMLNIRRKIAEAIYMTPKGDQVRLDMVRNAAHAAFDLTKQAKPDTVLSRQKAAALKKVLDIVRRAQDAINNRHRMMHDDWSVSGGETKEVRRIPVDGKAGRTPTPVPINDLNQQVKNLRALIDDVIDLTNEFDVDPPLLVSMKRGP